MHEQFCINSSGPVWEAAVGGIGGAFGVVFLKKREAGGKISIG